MISCMKPVIFYSEITFSDTKCFVHSYTVDVVFTLSYRDVWYVILKAGEFLWWLRRFIKPCLSRSWLISPAILAVPVMIFAVLLIIKCDAELFH